MEEKILKLLGRKNYVPAKVPELLRALKLPASDQQQLQKHLKSLERVGEIARIKGNRYIIPLEADLVPGRIQITRQGRGFLTPDDVGLPEIAIPASETGTAFHDDHVLVRRDVRPDRAGSRKAQSGPDKPDTGTVVRILERRRTQFVGTLKRGKNFLYVIPDDPRMPHDIYVPKPKDVGRPARNGDKVVVEFRGWESRHVNPEGEVVEVLGPPTAEGVDMLSILKQYDLPLRFPRKVLREAKRIGSTVSESDLEGRTDCRDHDVVTIDPYDAKDFDDAFYLERTRDERWKLWVHIADVSHYVKPGSELDREARQRGNSTYLVDRVIPMLPEALSNELCSLKPHVDRLSKCVEFLLDDEGKVLRSRFHSAVIHSKRRFSYEQAGEVLKGKARDEIEQMVQDAGQLAQKIRKRRFRNGSLDLEFPETKIHLDDRGRVDRIERVDYDESHQLIEEFMLLANEAVAARLLKLHRPTIHRVHEAPDPKRLADYREEVLSLQVPCGNLEKPTEVQRLLKRLNDLSIGSALKIGFLKSLMRARYAVESLGHYGLAKNHYAHFTSPIRRYADLEVHRSLFERTKQKKSKGAGGVHLELKRLADHLSSTERNSSDAERDSKNVKLYAYLQTQLKSGNLVRYRALVTDVRNFGVFVDVTDLGMNGVAPLSLLEDDFYEFDPTRVQVRGRSTGRVIGLGDEVEVVVATVDTFKRQVDFRLLGEGKEDRNNKRKRRSGSSSKRPRGSDRRKGQQDKPQRKRAGKKQASDRRRSPKKGQASRQGKGASGGSGRRRRKSPRKKGRS